MDLSKASDTAMAALPERGLPTPAASAGQGGAGPLFQAVLHQMESQWATVFAAPVGKPTAAATGAGLTPYLAPLAPVPAMGAALHDGASRAALNTPTAPVDAPGAAAPAAGNTHGAAASTPRGAQAARPQAQASAQAQTATQASLSQGPVASAVQGPDAQGPAADMATDTAGMHGLARRGPTAKALGPAVADTAPLAVAVAQALAWVPQANASPTVAQATVEAGEPGAPALPLPWAAPSGSAASRPVAVSGTDDQLSLAVWAPWGLPATGQASLQSTLQAEVARHGLRLASFQMNGRRSAGADAQPSNSPETPWQPPQ